MRWALQPDDQLLSSGKRQSFSRRWIELARDAGVDVRPVNVYRQDVCRQLQGCDGFLWWYPHIPRIRRLATRVIFSIQHGMGIPTFPNWQTIWHFDDKVSQKYLLDAAHVRTPETGVYWSLDEALTYCRQAEYPLVIKLAGGICSENVRKVANATEAEYWVSRLFGTGMTTLEEGPRPSLLTVASRRVRAARRALLGYPSDAASHELQRDYVLFQEFVPGNDCDTRITVIGDRAFGFRRFNRVDDFRASGSGKIDWAPERIEWRKVAFAFDVARRLGTQSLAVDILEHPDGSLVMNEISYYYEGWAVAACPGHWTPDGQWREGATAPEDAIFQDFLRLVQTPDARFAAVSATSMRFR